MSPQNLAQLSSVLAHPENVVTVLYATGCDKEFEGLSEILRHSRWRLFRATGCQDALSLIAKHRTPVVLCADELADGDWRRLWADLDDQPQPPRLIIASNRADDRLWSEALNLGAYDILSTPFEPAEVFRVISLAWQSSRRARSKPPARRVRSTPSATESIPAGRASATA
jgi:DNA-binding response OmpR family regulator